MSSLILLTLLPTKPRGAGDFNNDLADLTVDVFDLTVNDSITGIKLGTAHGVTQNPYFTPLTINPGPPGHPDKISPAIIQHFEITARGPPTPTDPLGVPLSAKPFSVATAVIVVDPANDQDFEYNSSDLRIVLTRDGKTLGTTSIEYNATVKKNPDPLSKDPQTYVKWADYSQHSDFPSAYVFVPPKLLTTPTNPAVDISADGRTPVFGTLIKAVNAVLKADHTTTGPGEKTDLEERAKPLTAAQARQVAAELIYDRGLLPPPQPKNKFLEDMYSNPAVDIKDDQDRNQFEGELKAYHATHDAEALQLSGFVFAASAAITCERMSLAAKKAALTVGVEVTPPPPGSQGPTISVLLNGATDAGSNPEGALRPTFGVPAAFFYVLGAILSTDLTAEERYLSALTTTEAVNLKSFQAAHDTGVLADKEKTLTDSSAGEQQLDMEQAARRLSALGSTNNSLFTTNLDSGISNVVKDWLDYTGKTADIGIFWLAESTGANAGQYLELLLRVIVAEKTDLKTKIVGILHVQKAADLSNISDKGWRDFFMPPKKPPGMTDSEFANLVAERAALLPDYTVPGTTAQRTARFIANLRRLLTMNTDVIQGSPPTPNGIPVLVGPGGDALRIFLQKSPGFDFSVALDPSREAALQTTLASLPMDAGLRKWTGDAVHVILFLYQITSGPITAGHPELQFSYMEALYARGFINRDRIALLTRAQFQAALAGTVAYPVQISHGIYGMATNSQADPAPGQEPGSGFTPVNAGEVVNCLPPPNLSPLGLVAYLHEILGLTVPGASGPATFTLGAIMESRRGVVGNLKASMSNLETSLPVIDLVNESLEGLKSQGSGRVNDTSSGTLAGFQLGSGPHDLNPELVFDAIPEHSTPAFPSTVAPGGIYEELAMDFSAPGLPYAQDLDIDRTYLGRLGLSRFDALRAFRQNITEFALDPTTDPTGFQADLWRFPVRLDAAIEYLQISPQELKQLFQSTLEGAQLANIFGFKKTERWMYEVAPVPVFLERTGLSYCELLELQKCCYVKFIARGTESGEFPTCAPCCLGELSIYYTEQDVPTLSLRKLAVFIRLWRKLRARYGKSCISFSLLAPICQALAMFQDNKLNPGFIHQLLALFMLCDTFCLPLRAEPGVSCDAPPCERVKLLALWADSKMCCEAREWAVCALLDSTERYAKRHYHCPPRKADFNKILTSNLEVISKLSGFTDEHSWNSTPECTLRFAEILAKIYASPFTVGEILFLFTTREHILGDDPFPYTEASESIEDPLNAPEDDRENGLWALRKKLLCVELGEEDVGCWKWQKIEHILREQFDLVPPTGPDPVDPLQILAEHFFPDVLETCGCPVPLENRQFRTPLAAADTSTLMWESSPHGPFHYRNSTAELWAGLPIRDEAVLKKLAHIRQLRPTGQAGPGEQRAVRELYFAPRAMLAPFALIFENFTEAVEFLVQEPSERKRFEYFQCNFAKFYRRCTIIAEHLSEHVDRMTACCGEEGKRRSCDTTLAWRLLRSLFADENRADGHWEMDTGKLPDGSTFKWDRKLSGSAFAAILGLVGTGLIGKYKVGGSDTVWREVRGPLSVFGEARNEWNAPIPTILPALGLPATAANQNLVIVRNGLALDDSSAAQLGGAQPFCVEWTGVLLVECHGDYRFHIHTPVCPREHGEKHGHCCDRNSRWLVTLRRGQKIWTLLNHNFRSAESAPARESLPICLLHGAFEICVLYEQPGPEFCKEEDLFASHTGFSVKYCGPDTKEEIAVLPIDKLYTPCKDGRLDSGIECVGDNPSLFLSKQYFSSLRDIRRTYLRAFKSLLFAHRYNLSAEPKEYCHGESEMGLLLQQRGSFAGTSYYRPANSPAFSAHQADFDFNFMPVDDAYFPPSPQEDSRTAPSAQRMSALFDWWERMYDYRHLVHEVHQVLHAKHPRWFLWRMFYEAAIQQAAEPNTLVRHLGVDVSLSPLVLTYFEKHGLHTVDLTDERWPIRIWHAWCLVQKMLKALPSRSFETARPDLWASDLPSLIVSPPGIDPPLSGNNNLMHLVQEACLKENKIRLFKDVKKLDDGLRERARQAMVAYFCRMDRVSLPFSGIANASAKAPQDLSDLLLQDVEVRLCTHSTRIEDAIRAVQTFVHRSRLGLEPTYALPATFLRDWDSTFCTYEKWKNCQRRTIYRENWIQWEELERARKSEAFKFLEDRLPRHEVTIPKSSPGFVLDLDELPMGKSALEHVQCSESAMVMARTDSPDEGLAFIGVPARDGRPSWLAPLPIGTAETAPDLPAGGESGPTPSLSSVPIPPATETTVEATAPESSGNGKSGPGSAPTPTSSTPAHDTDEALRGSVHAINAGRIAMVRSVAPDTPETLQIPLWFQAAVRLGTRFVRVAAAGLPLAERSLLPMGEELKPDCTCPCGKDHAPVVDEYYFWLTDGRWFNGQDVISNQDADIGMQPPDPTSDWDRPDKAPSMLRWASKPLVHLAWTRVHLGSFEPPRRSAEGARYDPSADAPTLGFKGRKGDSLLFEAVKSTNGGFRYDIATGSAVVTPQIVEDTPPDQALPTPLSAFPYFVYFNPGAPLVPVSSFAMTLSIVGTLRAHCRFEEALAWCRAIFDPLQRSNNTWVTCPSKPPDPLCPPPGIARARAVLLEYVEILLQWGDSLMCKASVESTNQAFVLFNEAARVLGPEPGTSKLGGEASGGSMTVGSFCPVAAPLNPKLVCLYQRTYDRRKILQNCLTSSRLGRNCRQRLDSEAWIDRVCSLAGSVKQECCVSEENCVSCCLPYRFTSMFSKAVETVGMVKSLGGALLSALEKGDAEYLAGLRQAHEHQLLELTLETRQFAFRESDWQVQALEKQMEGAQTRLRYYTQLLQRGLNSGETAHISQTNVAVASRTSGNISEGIGQAMNFIPDMTIGAAGVGGTPVDINQIPIGTKLSQVFSAAARILNVVGDISSTNAGLSATTASWERRAEEWQHQVDVITIEIAQIKRQQLAADRRRDMALRDLNNHQEQIQHSTEIQDFMRDKLSKHDLYLFLQQETASLYRRAYDLALQTARDAQIAFSYERRDLPVELPVAAWNNLREGLMSGESLDFALQSLHRLYMKTNCREYELSKHLSLRLHFPLAFLQLKALGWCEIEVAEWMFDLDYPGHYMRRIKNVSVTIPCIAGPYTGVHCRLQLLSSGIRLDASTPGRQSCCCREGCADQEDDCSYDDYHNLSRQFISSEAIATSTGQNDSGLFELSFHDERFVPFEFSGAVSRWRIELPPKSNQFDLETLSDFIMHLNFTAREGGALLRSAAEMSAQRHLPGDGIRFFDVRHEFPDYWAGIFAPTEKTMEKGRRHKTTKGQMRDFPLAFSRRSFPFLTGRRSVTITSLHIFIETERAVDCAEHFTAHFIPHEGCEHEEKSFVCLVGEDMSSFYKGVLDVVLGPIREPEQRPLGHLRFPEALRRACVRQVYLLCHYVAGEAEEFCHGKRRMVCCKAD